MLSIGGAVLFLIYAICMVLVGYLMSIIHHSVDLKYGNYIVSGIIGVLMLFHLNILFRLTNI